MAIKKKATTKKTAVKKSAPATKSKTIKKTTVKKTEEADFKAPSKKLFELPSEFKSKSEWKRTGKAIGNQTKKLQMELKDVLKEGKIKTTEIKKLAEDHPSYNKIEQIQTDLVTLAEIKKTYLDMEPEASEKTAHRWEYPEGLTDPKEKGRFRRFMRNHTRGDKAISIEEALNLWAKKDTGEPKKKVKKDSTEKKEVLAKKNKVTKTSEKTPAKKTKVTKTPAKK